MLVDKEICPSESSDCGVNVGILHLIDNAIIILIIISQARFYRFSDLHMTPEKRQTSLLGLQGPLSKQPFDSLWWPPQKQAVFHKRMGRATIETSSQFLHNKMKAGRP